MRQSRSSSFAIALGGVSISLGLLACGSGGSGACACTANQVCTTTGDCIEACAVDNDCGSCGRCQLGGCVRTAECEATLVADPSAVTLAAGASTNVALAITRGEGFSAPLTLALTGSLPPGLTATFDPAVADADTATLELVAAADSHATVRNLVVRAEAAGVAADAALTVTLTGAAAGFTLSGPVAAVAAAPGGVAEIEISVERFAGYSDDILLSMSYAPFDYLATFAPQPATVAVASVTMRVSVPAGAALGHTVLTVRGESSAGFAATVDVALDVEPMVIQGRVVTAAGLPVPAAAVVVAFADGGGDTAVTELDGTFRFTEVSSPYLLTVGAPGSGAVEELAGLTAMRPVIALVADAGLDWGWVHRAAFDGAITRAAGLAPADTFQFPLGVHQRLIVAGTGGALAVLSAAADGTADGELTWFGLAALTTDLVACEYELGAPMTFGAFGVAEAVAVVADASHAFALELDTPVPTMSFEFGWDAGAYAGGTVSGGVLAFDLAGVRFPVGLAGGAGSRLWTTTESPMPITLPADGGLLMVEATRPEASPGTGVGAYSARVLQPVATLPAPPTVEVDLPAAISLYPISPADGAVITTTLTPTLTWSPVSGAALVILHLAEETAAGPALRVRAVMAGDATSWEMADYSAFDVELAIDRAYRWQVTAISADGFTVDDFVDAEGGGLAKLLTSAQGATIVSSGSQRFHTYPCAPSNGGVETCDGVDNDCNTVVDDLADIAAECVAGFPGVLDVAAWSCARGACQIAACVLGAADVDHVAATGCEAVCVVTGAERCNGADDDCNGAVDEGFPLGLPCGGGDCVGGVTECSASGSGVRCSSEPGGSEPQTSGEVCDNRDNDCDGTVDDDDAIPEPCYCTDGVLDPLPIEICTDGIDNDCNDAVDDRCCGNDLAEGVEECDGADLNNEDCVSLGLGAGTLDCGADCRFDVAACAPLALDGLVITEVYYDPPGADDGREWVELYNAGSVDLDFDATPYTLASGGPDFTSVYATHVPLSGTLAAGACWVVGGPTTDAASWEPVYDLAVDFAPDFQNSGDVADGVAVFFTPPYAIDSDSVPVTAVLFGGANVNELPDELGHDGRVDVGDVDPGWSIVRTPAGWREQLVPSPNDCAHALP